MIQSIEDRVGQMIMAGFDGLTAPEYFLDWLREGRIGGVILFARNVASPEQLARLTKQLHDAAKYPLLIAIDQEGGTVARLRDGFTESPGAMALASISDGAEDVTMRVSQILGEEMAELGINWTFAPSVDISYNADNPTVGTRSFGSDPKHVATLASAAIKGFQAGGVAACAKHFPGLGNTAIDTHLALAKLDTPLEHLLAVDLEPYRVAMQNGLATIMTTHTLFTELDKDHPATLSEHIIARLIREELGFDGVVTTDCLEMKAIDDHYGIAESSLRAANAGVDIILVSHTADKQSKAYDSLLEAVKRGDVAEAVINKANKRIATLKARFPVQEPQTVNIYSKARQSVVGEAARAGMTLLREEDGVLPLTSDDKRRIVVLEMAIWRDSLVQDFDDKSPLTQLLQKKLPHAKCATVSFKTDGQRIDDLLKEKPDVLVIVTRNAHLSAEQASYIRDLSKRGKHVILLALRNPYDASLIEGGTVLCTAGDSNPSLQAVVDALAGEFVPNGSLPVEV
jgi:beta-N-acetylhexosaminidase